VTCQHRAPPTHSPAAADNCGALRKEGATEKFAKKASREKTTRCFKFADPSIDFIGSTGTDRRTRTRWRFEVRARASLSITIITIEPRLL
jgi:hypothetical protein